MSNVAEPVWQHAAATPDALALSAGSGQWSYARLRREAARFGGTLVSEGVSPGDRVLLVAPSEPEFVVAYLAMHAVGAVAVTPNVMSTVPELEYIVADAGCSRILAWHEVRPAPQLVARSQGIPFAALLPDLEGIHGGVPITAPHRRASTDTAVILYTSGTTGRPKGAQITEGNLRACAEIFQEVLRLTPADRFGTALPLFHIFGQAVVLGGTLRAGASLSLLARFDAAEMLELLRRDRVTVLAGVPTMYNALLQVGVEAGPGDFAELRLAASGGASLPGELLRAFNERFGCVILEGYGLTETTGAATFNGLDRERKPGCVGIALPRTEVRVVGEGGEELPVGSVGEVLVCGPTVMKGYWNREQATAEVLQDGWLHTGDLGTQDAEGDIRIVDRVKDLIVRGGYNVYPREVEEVLYEHPDIVEVAVVGVPDEHYGEEVGAVITLAPGASLDGETLRAWTKERLSAYKVPRLFAFVEELPKGPTGKILKRSIERSTLVPVDRETPAARQ